MDKKDKEMTLINKVGRAIWGKVIGKTIEFISVTGMLGYTLFLYEKGNLNAYNCFFLIICCLAVYLGGAGLEEINSVNLEVLKRKVKNPVNWFTHKK